jgi:hypothetical protein
LKELAADKYQVWRINNNFKILIKCIKVKISLSQIKIYKLFNFKNNKNK